MPRTEQQVQAREELSKEIQALLDRNRRMMDAKEQDEPLVIQSLTALWALWAKLHYQYRYDLAALLGLPMAEMERRYDAWVTQERERQQLT